MIALARRIPQADQFVRQGKWPGGNYPLLHRTHRQDRRHSRPRPHRQGNRRPRPGHEDARRLSRPQAPGRRALYLLRQPHRHGARQRLAGAHRPRRQGHREASSRAKSSKPSAPRACSSTSPAARWSTSRPCSNCCRTAASAAPRSTSSRRNRRCPKRFFALDNVVLSPHQGSATHQTRDEMGALVVANLDAHFAGEPLISAVV